MQMKAVFIDTDLNMGKAYMMKTDITGKPERKLFCCLFLLLAVIFACGACSNPRGSAEPGKRPLNG